MPPAFALGWGPLAQPRLSVEGLSPERRNDTVFPAVLLAPGCARIVESEVAVTNDGPQQGFALFQLNILQTVVFSDHKIRRRSQRRRRWQCARSYRVSGARVSGLGVREE